MYSMTNFFSSQILITRILEIHSWKDEPSLRPCLHFQEEKTELKGRLAKSYSQ